MIEYRIWNELYTAKKNDYYLSKYLAYLRDKRDKISLAKAAIAIIGIILNVWVKNSSIVTLVALTLFEFFKEMIPIISIDEKLIDRIPEYRMLNVDKYEALDRIFLKLRSKDITEKQAQDQYNRIRVIDRRMEEIDNSIKLKVRKKLFKEADEKTKTHMENMYNFENEELNTEDMAKQDKNSGTDNNTGHQGGRDSASNGQIPTSKNPPPPPRPKSK
ncbi:hypothetical protein [Sphingobacterium detergens]